MAAEDATIGAVGTMSDRWAVGGTEGDDAATLTRTGANPDEGPDTRRLVVDTRVAALDPADQQDLVTLALLSTGPLINDQGAPLFNDVAHMLFQG